MDGPQGDRQEVPEAEHRLLITNGLSLRRDWVLNMNRGKGLLSPSLLLSALFLLVAMSVSPSRADVEPGRTDGSENSEYGTGGYRMVRLHGQYYLEGYYGAAVVDIEPDDAPNVSRTDLMGGINAGYMIEDYLAFQIGYGHIAGDTSADLFSMGMWQSMNRAPFNYLFGIDAEIYSPDGGSSKFGIAPGVGAELILNESLQVGLRFQHDFIFTDDNISINRFSARLQYNF